MSENMKHSTHQPSLLIVDDVPANLELLGSLLITQYRVQAVTRGEQALALARREPHPDLILLDVMMPEMDGFEVCRQLKEDPRTADIPVIFLTALDDDLDEERGLRLGAVDYITKPVRPAIVLARVATQLELQSARRQLLDRNAQLEDMVVERTADLELARGEAVQASRAKSAFLASMSHELRTPLNVILGFAQVLEFSPRLDESERGHVQTIRSSGEHLLHLIEDIFDLTMIESGRFDVTPCMCDLNGTLQTLACQVAGRAEEAKLEFYFRSTGDLPPVTCDQRRLQRVLFHLLDNAVRYTKQGEVVLAAEASDDAVVIHIEDSGPGIPDERMQNCFTPFLQVGDNPYIQRGPGVGLALAHGVIRACGGELDIDTSHAHGTKLHVRLPR